MRKNHLLSALFLLCSSSLFADDVLQSQWRVSVLASEISTGSNEPWDDGAEPGFGFGIAYAPNARWDVELSASTQNHVSPYTRFFLMTSPNPEAPPLLVPVTEFKRYDVMPLELSVTRHFLRDQPIAPYVRAGVRHVGAPEGPTQSLVGYNPGPLNPYLVPVSEGFHFSDRTSAQLGAGARIRLTPRTAIRAEVNRSLRSDEADFDRLTRVAVGLSWLF